MTSNDRKNTEAKILDGVRIAVLRLVENKIKSAGELTVYREEKVMTIKARETKLK